MLRAIESRWSIAVVCVVAALLGLHSISSGFVTDDYAFRAAVRSTSSHAPAAWDLFRLAPGDPAVARAAIGAGRAPWWMTPDLRIHFARPLTSLLFALDVRVFGDHPLGYHLHSLAWFVATLAAAGACLRKMVPRGAATLALAVFAWHAGHIEAYAWPSARHVLVAAAPAFLALSMVLRGRRVTALALFIVALAGGELALGIVPFWIALELSGPERRWKQCLPLAGVVATYLVAYHALGFGVSGGDGYRDPIGDPLGFASVALPRLPVLLGDALLDVPAELGLRGISVKLAVVGVAGVSLVACALGPARARELGWIIAGALGATLLGTTGFPGGRVLVVADLGFAAVVATATLRVFDSPWPVRLVPGFLALVHLVVSPLLAWREIGEMALRARASEAVAREAVALGRARDLVVVAASDPFVFLYPQGVAADLAPGAVRCWSVLSAARSAHRLTRLDDHTLALESLDRPFLFGFDTLFRSAEKGFAVGDSVEQCALTIRIASVVEGRPTKLEVSSRRSLDDEALAFVVWRGGHLVRVTLPPPGRSVDLRWEAGPARML